MAVSGADSGRHPRDECARAPLAGRPACASARISAHSPVRGAGAAWRTPRRSANRTQCPPSGGPDRSHESRTRRRADGKRGTRGERATHGGSAASPGDRRGTRADRPPGSGRARAPGRASRDCPGLGAGGRPGGCCRGGCAADSRVVAGLRGTAGGRGDARSDGRGARHHDRSEGDGRDIPRGILIVPAATSSTASAIVRV